jgi:hypothetical protein
MNFRVGFSCCSKWLINFFVLGIYEKSKKEKKEKEREEARLEKLAKKIQAENEINWLDPQKTLREQGRSFSSLCRITFTSYFYLLQALTPMIKLFLERNTTSTINSSILAT